MNKLIKITVLIIMLGTIIYLSYLTINFCSNFPFGKSYNIKDLIENYKIKKLEINDLSIYINKIVPENTKVYIEINEEEQLGILTVIKNGKYYNNLDLTIHFAKCDTLLGWSKGTLEKLKVKLKSANCVSIENGEPTTIGYQRSGMGMYYYKVFNLPLTEKQKVIYNDSCKYIYFKDNIVLEFSGGAAGPQCL